VFFCWFCSVIDPLLVTGSEPSREQDDGHEARWMSHGREAAAG
jgi:hypothetical protein